MAPNDEGFYRDLLEEIRKIDRKITSLEAGIDSKMLELQKLITDFQIDKHKINEVKSWKDDLTNHISITDLKDMKESSQEFKIFKAKAITVFFVVQSLMALAVFYKQMFGG